MFEKKPYSAAQKREKLFLVKVDLTQAKKATAGDAGKKETEMEPDLQFM